MSSACWSRVGEKKNRRKYFYIKADLYFDIEFAKQQTEDFNHPTSVQKSEGKDEP